MSDDTISRQAAIATAISGRVRTLPTTEDGENWIRVNEVRDSLLSLPSAERHGRWIEADDMPRLDNTFSIRCSLCGQLMLAHPNEENPNFCCNCGAMMDEVEE